MNLYELRVEEERKHLEEVTERTKAGELKWECIDYFPVSLMDEDLVDEKSAYLSQSFILKTHIEGIPYSLEFLETIDVPSGMGDIAVTLIREIPDDFRRIDCALGGYYDEYDDCQPEDLKEVFRNEIPFVLSNILIPKVASSECVSEAFTCARFHYGDTISDDILHHPLVKLGATLFNQHRVLDFHRCVLDTEFRTKVLTERK